MTKTISYNEIIVLSLLNNVNIDRTINLMVQEDGTVDIWYSVCKLMHRVQLLNGSIYKFKLTLELEDRQVTLNVFEDTPSLLKFINEAAQRLIDGNLAKM